MVLSMLNFGVGCYNGFCVAGRGCKFGSSTNGDVCIYVFFLGLFRMILKCSYY